MKDVQGFCWQTDGQINGLVILYISNKYHWYDIVSYVDIYFSTISISRYLDILIAEL